MKFLLKTAPAAVVSLTLLGGAAYSDAGFAFGASNGEKLSAQTISIDPTVLAADQAALTAATTGSVSVTKLQNGDVMFTPGTGSPNADVRDDEPVAEDNEILKANSLSELVRAQSRAVSPLRCAVWSIRRASSPLCAAAKCRRSIPEACTGVTLWRSPASHLTAAGKARLKARSSFTRVMYRPAGA